MVFERVKCSAVPSDSALFSSDLQRIPSMSRVRPLVHPRLERPSQATTGRTPLRPSRTRGATPGLSPDSATSAYISSPTCSTARYNLIQALSEPRNSHRSRQPAAVHCVSRGGPSLRRISMTIAALTSLVPPACQDNWRVQAKGKLMNPFW